jgi:hypothetical protein
VAWRGRWEVVTADVAAIEAGEATLDDHPDADAVLVRAPRELDELAVHPRTGRGLVVHALPGGRILARQRYESWVAFPPPGTQPRIGLDRVAAALAARERSVRWLGEGPDTARARLYPADARGSQAATALDPEAVIEEIARERGRARTAGGPR